MSVIGSKADIHGYVAKVRLDPKQKLGSITHEL